MFDNRSKIRLDKGDTLGGTAPLVLLDKVTTGGKHRLHNKRGRTVGISLSAWISTLISVSVLAGLFAAALHMVDWDVLWQGVQLWLYGTSEN